jgi:hypothetical protein
MKLEVDGRIEKSSADAKRIVRRAVQTKLFEVTTGTCNVGRCGWGLFLTRQTPATMLLVGKEEGGSPNNASANEKVIRPSGTDSTCQLGEGGRRGAVVVERSWASHEDTSSRLDDERHVLGSCVGVALGPRSSQNEAL